MKGGFQPVSLHPEGVYDGNLPSNGLLEGVVYSISFRHVHIDPLLISSLPKYKSDHGCLR